VLSRVAATLSRSLVSYSATVIEPTDDGYLYGYDLLLADPMGLTERRQVFLEAVPGLDTRPGVLTVPIEGSSNLAAVWLYPNDPALPALASITDVNSAREALGSLGVEIDPTEVTVVSYRPGHRAVVRVASVNQTVFVKVVEPGKAESIAERHELFRVSGIPVPRILGSSADGLIAMTALPGVDAQTVIGRPTDANLPLGAQASLEQAVFLEQVEFLTSLLAGVPSFNTARSSLFDRLDWYVDRLAEHLPADAERIQLLGTEILARGRDGRGFEFTPVTIHGDLHIGQLFVDESSPSLLAGLLDIDTAGTGDPADDAAALYAHLVTFGESLADVDPGAAQRCLSLSDAWLARWQYNSNAGFEARARAIAATHLLGHALRPLSADPDALGRRLLDRAQALVSSEPAS
jgi:aminoglycoside phosphotransferase (APT) family kinase protein